MNKVCKSCNHTENAYEHNGDECPECGGYLRVPL